MSTDQWKKENMKQYNLRVTIKSGIPEALEKAASACGKSPVEYIRQTLVDQLEFEGYLQHGANFD